MTVEGWVYPTRKGGWRAVAVKETARGLAWGLYASGARGRPSGHVSTASELWAAARTRPRLRRWTHLAVTYDGAEIRTYVNGRLAATREQFGPLQVSAQPLRFGGDAVWPEWFAGRLDEIRVYDGALTASQIRADMHHAVAGTKQRSHGRPSKGAKVRRYRARHPHGG
jgi:hypothetical protein